MKIGIIGFGDMGRSLITGLIKQGVPAKDIVVCDKSDRAVKKAGDLNLEIADTDTVAEKCDAVLIAIPKKAFTEMADEWKKFSGKLIFSCMAEVKMRELKAYFDGQIVRVIPTLAAENGLSIVGICFDEKAEAAGNKERIKEMFSKVGTVIDCTEEELAPLTALAACGLCYAAYILNCFINTAENLGFDREVGQNIVEKTFHAAMELGDYELVIGKIAGRGGITISGVNVMDEGNVHKNIDTAFKTAYGALLK